MKRILIFSTAYFPFVGGAEVSIKEITDRLSSEFEFDLITARLQKDLPRVEKISKVTVYRIGMGVPLLDKLWLPIGGAVRAWHLNNYQSYHCLWGVMVTFASGAGYVLNISRRLLGKKKIPMVLTLQEGDSEVHLKYRWFGLLALSWRLALSQTDILTGLSNFLLERARKNGYKGKSILVPNGVNLEVFTKKINEKDKTDIKKSLDKKEGEVFLVTTSRLVHKNGIDDVISALVDLPKNIKFVVIGVGDLKVRLQKQASDLGVSDRVKFLDLIPNVDLPKYFSVCDIFIRASRSEGFGISFIEAMASNLPVIATAVGGIPDFLDNKETGLFCLPNNPKSIVKAVKLLLDDKDLRENIIKKAHDMVVERYSWDRIANSMKSDVFEKLNK
ncbi:MAG: glycosyltransferase family 4 protein [Minisyncoccia bacterium]